MSETTNHVDIIEVGPRDGFQNLCSYLPAERKIYYIDQLIATGIKHLQITSFVSPKAIPQMQDATTVAKTIVERHPDLDLFALVPNFRGAQNAHEAGLKKVNTVISLSRSHNMANVRKTHDQSFKELHKIIEQLSDMEVVLDVATAFGCPFEGKQRSAQAVVDFCGRAYDMGVRTFNLCDTVGQSDPAQVASFTHAMKKAFPDARLELHIHDTRGMGIVCSLEGWKAGADGIQSTLGGLGGCPFAPGASGNTATKDLVFMFEEMGVQTGISFDKILTLAKEEHQEIPGNYSGANLLVKNTIHDLIPVPQNS